MGPLKIRNYFWFRLIEVLYKTFTGKLYEAIRHPRVLRHLAKQINEKIAVNPVDILFSPSTIPMAMLDTNIPIIIFPDAVFAGLHNFYHTFANVASISVKAAHRQEKSALDRCSVAIFSSEWAARTAIENYHTAPGKVKVLPYGANIDTDLSFDQIKMIVNKKRSHTCKLLFMGVDWKRKGGDVAFAVTKYLNEHHCKAELTIIGSDPENLEKEDIPSYIRPLGFISKSTPSGKQQIQKILEESHFLLLPTEADCTPIVFAEANSWGVPCITTNVGGIPSVITNHVNGVMFATGEPVENYAAFIREYFTNYEKYTGLAYSSYNEYLKRLNWEATGRKLKEIFTEVIRES